jgi:hypothetical protein
MEDPHAPIQPPVVEGRFTWRGLVLAIVIAPIFGLIWAWAADGVQSYFAPLILFPILVGVCAGLSIVGVVRFAQIGHRPTVLMAAGLAGAVAAAGQHYVGYLDTYYTTRPVPELNVAAGQDLSALMREMRPSFIEYMRAQARWGRPLTHGYVAQGWLTWLTWVIDGLLVVAAAVVVAMPASRVPYCNRCGTWYRTIRSSRIDVPTAAHLAELIGVTEIGHPRSPRYRLSACQGGCGPTRIELSWEEADGAIDLVQVWLDAAGRNQIAAVLDGMNTKDEG